MVFSHLNPADHHSARITKTNKDFAKTFDFKVINFPVKTGGIHRIEKKNSNGISVLVMKIKKNIQSMYCEEKPVDFLLIGEGEKKHYVFNQRLW